ncbi:DUF692 family multinuclear iron-containing protein [Thiomonas intermedia]|uniref:HvfB family MNIO-type RiPP peptide maturase n=1 Tax=Thiomonas intermedia TaxID=926 RepID=UPI0014752E03|nr:DUF692 family multinuclear iron-containing protein [Thiomonas intermedia]
MSAATPACGGMAPRHPQGAGLGLRQDFLAELQSALPEGLDFFEIAPENWIGVGGESGRALRALTERAPFVCHGLSLSLGGPGPLNVALLRQIRQFMDLHGMALYTEHLAWCADTSGQLYELLPLPFTEEAVRHVAARIRQTQDVLGQRIAVENASYYAAHPNAPLSEIEFIQAVLAEADCDLHLDVNNLYVNCANHGGDPAAQLRALPSERIAYLHIAGHRRMDDGLLLDTHGAAVIDPVWQLLQTVYAHHGMRPTLLERDNHLPTLEVLMQEVRQIGTLQSRASPATGVVPPAMPRPSIALAAPATADRAEALQDTQAAFAARLRRPRGQPCPAGLKARRVDLYARLVHANVNEALLGAFPRLRGLLSARRWSQLVRRFVAEHGCQTPFFRDLGGEFVAFLQGPSLPLADHAPGDAGPPQVALTPAGGGPTSRPGGRSEALCALAHFEWTRGTLMLDDPEAVACQPDGDLLHDVPVCNPALRLVHYDWPVHTLRPRQRIAPVATDLALYRVGADQVRCAQINPLTAQLIERLRPGELTGSQAIASLRGGRDDPAAAAAYLDFGAALLRDLRLSGVLLGSRAAADAAPLSLPVIAADTVTARAASAVSPLFPRFTL